MVSYDILCARVIAPLYRYLTRHEADSLRWSREMTHTARQTTRTALARLVALHPSLAAPLAEHCPGLYTAPPQPPRPGDNTEPHPLTPHTTTPAAFAALVRSTATLPVYAGRYDPGTLDYTPPTPHWPYDSPAGLAEYRRWYVLDAVRLLDTLARLLATPAYPALPELHPSLAAPYPLEHYQRDDLPPSPQNPTGARASPYAKRYASPPTLAPREPPESPVWRLHALLALVTAASAAKAGIRPEERAAHGSARQYAVNLLPGLPLRTDPDPHWPTAGRVNTLHWDTCPPLAHVLLMDGSIVLRPSPSLTPWEAVAALRTLARKKARTNA